MKKISNLISYSQFLNNENIILNFNKDYNSSKCVLQNGDYLKWQNQKSYLKLLNDFNNRKISLVEFFGDFRTYDFLLEDMGRLFAKNLILFQILPVISLCILKVIV